MSVDAGLLRELAPLAALAPKALCRAATDANLAPEVALSCHNSLPRRRLPGPPSGLPPGRVTPINSVA